MDTYDLTEETTAKQTAQQQSTGSTGYACVILSRGKLYVETEVPIIRTWETLIAEYQNGHLLNKSHGTTQKSSY